MRQRLLDDRVYPIPSGLQGPLLYVVRLAIASGIVTSIVIGWSSALHRQIARHDDAPAVARDANEIDHARDAYDGSQAFDSSRGLRPRARSLA